MKKQPLPKLFVNAILDYNNNEIDITRAINSCAETAEDFAIEFALWKETIMQDENGLYFSESRAQISRNNPVNIKKLLDVFKHIRLQAE